MLPILAIFYPLGFFVIVACFGSYQLFLVLHMCFFHIIGTYKFRAAEETDWKAHYYSMGLSKNVSRLEWDNVVHYVIIPNYKEDMSCLQETLERIGMSSIAKSSIIPCLAMEGREQGSNVKAEELISQFRSYFKDMIYTTHPPDIEGEVAGKSSNEAWAANKVYEDATKSGYDEDYVIITICDADSLFHQKYFECLTAKFCTQENRYWNIYQAPMLCYQNWNSIPVWTKIISAAVSIHEVACCADSLDEHVPFSTYSMSIRLAKFTGGWDTDIIPEDWHMYIKCVFATGGKTSVEPIHLPTWCTAVEADGYFASLWERWVQAKRHAWGVSELSYFTSKVLNVYQTKPSVFRMLWMSYKMYSVHLLAALQLFILTMSGFVLTFTAIYNYFKPTAVGVLILGWWSFPFRYTQLFSLFPTIGFIFSATYFLQMAPVDPPGSSLVSRIWYKLNRNRFFAALRLTLEYLIWSPFSFFFFAYLPIMIQSLKLIFVDTIRYEVAAKPQAQMYQPILVDDPESRETMGSPMIKTFDDSDADGEVNLSTDELLPQ